MYTVFVTWGNFPAGSPLESIEFIMAAFRRPSQFAAYQMVEVTQILSAIEQGDPSAAEQLLPLVYNELRKLAAQRIAQEKPGQTLQATALVHDAYVRLVDVTKVQRWDSRGHFFAAAAEAMRRILVERARQKGSLKRGGTAHRIDFDQLSLAVDDPSCELLALEDRKSVV